MSLFESIALEQLMPPRTGSVDPSAFPDEEFDLYSIPAFDRGEPERVKGKEIGSSKQIVRPGDVLLSRIVPHIRRAWVVDRNRGRRIIASGEWIVLRGDLFEPNYLRRVVVSDAFHVQFMRTVSGVGGSLLRARPAYVGKIRIPLPPLAEQRRIAEILDKADALRTKRRAATAQLDMLAQSIFLDMFGDPAMNPKRFPVTDLAALCERVIDCPHATPTYARARTEYPCIRSSDIQLGELDFSDAKYVERQEYEARIARGAPQMGDVVYCREGARFGNAARITTSATVCLGQRMMLFRPDAAKAVGEYLWAFFGTRHAYTQASRLVGGSASPHVNIRDILAVRLPKPPVALQTVFADRVKLADGLKAAHRKSIGELDNIFMSLQQRVFMAEL